jgi:hypothetical protein
LPLLIFTLACLLLGTWLARSGLRPRPSGNTPHCGKCGYALVGIEANTCPECGADLAGEDGVVRGERIIKWKRAGAGLLLMAMAIGCLIAAFVRGTADIDWYEYRPFNWVMRDLDGPSTVAKQAMDEVRRRCDSRELSAAQTSTLVDRLLKEQVSNKTPPHGQLTPMMQLLESILLHEKMSVAQRQRFLMAATDAKLTLVPGASSDPPLIRLICEGNASGSAGTLIRISLFDKLEWDGVRRSAEAGAAMSTYLGAPTRETIPIPTLKPGKHRLIVSIKTSVDCQPVFRRQQDLSIDFEMPAPPQPIEWLAPPMPSLNRLGFSPGVFTAVSNGTTTSIHGTITVTRPSANVAMEAYARIGGNYLPMGMVRVPQGQILKVELEAMDLPFPLVSSFDMDVLLSSSEKAARAGKPPFKEAWSDSFTLRVHVEKTVGAVK